MLVATLKKSKEVYESLSGAWARSKRLQILISNCAREWQMRQGVLAV
jgi:hypothetical protein